jgi:hypothetical protein
MDIDTLGAIDRRLLTESIALLTANCYRQETPSEFARRLVLTTYPDFPFISTRLAYFNTQRCAHFMTARFRMTMTAWSSTQLLIDYASSMIAPWMTIGSLN